MPAPLRLVPQAPKPRILVADDDPVMRSFLRLVLATDYDVVVANDGREAIAALDREEPFACVVSDDRMPHASGFEVAEHVRDTPRLRGVPVILITAKTANTATRQAESHAAGAAAYLNKPFSRLQLTTLVGALAKGRSVRTLA